MDRGGAFGLICMIPSAFVVLAKVSDLHSKPSSPIIGEKGGLTQFIFKLFAILEHK